MGYSNNKWRKILTILMVINLCFVLFAKFSRVFGAEIYFPDINENIEISSSLNDDYNIILFFHPVGNEYVANLIATEKNTKFVLNPNGNNPNLLYFNKKSSYHHVYYRGSVSSIKNYFLTLNSSSFSLDTTSFDGTPSMVGTYTGIINSYNNNVLYTNTDILSYSNLDNVLVPPNLTFYTYPHFDNIDEIEGGYPNGVYISRGDYSSSDNLYFHLLSVNNTTVPSPGNSVFYYSDNVYELNKDSSYYKEWLGDNNEDYSYYYIPRYKLSFDMNTSYVYVLSDSPEIINNSYNHIEIDVSNGVYDVLESDTTGVMTATDEESDRLKRIEDEAVQQANNSSSINNALTNTTTDTQNEEDISNNLDFNNNNSALNNANSGFFSRLVSILNGIIDYDMEEDSTVTFPIPFTNKTITLHSNFMSQNVPEPLYTIIQAFWLFLFNFYLFRFVNKIYIAFSTGKILSDFNSSDEVITNSML